MISPRQPVIDNSHQDERPGCQLRRTIDRRDFLSTSLAGLSALALGGCGGSDGAINSGGLGKLDTVWGVHGIVKGRMHKPRAMAIDQDDNLYLVDFTARILVYDADGNFLRGWSTPASESGRPTGLTYDPIDNLILVADTHYYRVLHYSLEGKLLDEKTIGGVHGHGPGEFGFVTDAVRDSEGNYYISEYGEYDRIQKFSPSGEFLLEWGSHGNELNQFKRPQNLLMDEQNRLWVCDACNHRMQVFSTEGELLFHWGKEGSELGDLYYPYDLVMDKSGDLFISEFGNHRVQKFTREGKSLGVWGTHGNKPGELWDPWALVCDSRGRIHILDTRNHRVQRILV